MSTFSQQQKFRRIDACLVAREQHLIGHVTYALLLTHVSTVATSTRHSFASAYVLSLNCTFDRMHTGNGQLLISCRHDLRRRTRISTMYSEVTLDRDAQVIHMFDSCWFLVHDMQIQHPFEPRHYGFLRTRMALIYTWLLKTAPGLCTLLCDSRSGGETDASPWIVFANYITSVTPLCIPSPS